MCADRYATHQLDFGAKVRVLQDSGADATQSGAAFSIYRHFGNNAEIGLGYEWGNVIDDLADIDYISEGVFLNIVAKLWTIRRHYFFW